MGSGCLVGGRLVLTAAHNVLTDGSVDDVISVRLGDRFELAAEVLAADPAQDLAVLRAADHPSLTDMPVVRYARIDRGRTALVECWAMGYPGWNEHPQSGTEVPLRDSSQINGVIPPGSHLRRGLLEFRTQSTPEGTPGRNGSQWRGMSGAVVFSDDPQLGALAVGVISEHHLPEGASTLTVVPLTGLIETIDWFAEEHLNVQANIRRAYESHEWELLLRLVEPLYGLLFHRSQWEEMEAVKAMAVEAARTRRDESAELGSLIHLAEARRILGRREETTGLYERALEIARARGDEGKEGWILTHFGDLQCDLERPGDALCRYAEARAVYRHRGDKGAEIWLSAHMADAYRQLDRPQDAARVLTDALEESRRRGDPAEIVWCQWHLALAYDQMGRYAEAEETLAPATEFHRHRADRAGLATMLTIQGDIHLHAGRPALAREAYGEALDLVRSLDIPRRVAELEAALERASG